MAIPAPSQEDTEITRRLKETGDMLGIRVLDHVCSGRSDSFRSATEACSNHRRKFSPARVRFVAGRGTIVALISGLEIQNRKGVNDFGFYEN